MFKRKTPELKEIDLLNKFNIMENKIDILNFKFESITYLDGCCDCKERDNKNYEMLVEYFETKFLEIQKESVNEKEEFILKKDLEDFKNEILVELKNTFVRVTNQHQSICKSNFEQTFVEVGKQNFDIKTMFTELMDVISRIKVIDNQEYHIKHQNGINNIQNLLNIYAETAKNSDIKLRNDLQSFLLGLQNNIVVELKNLTEGQDINKSLQTISDHVTNLIGELNVNLENINSKVNSFYFENELIKHQLLLEENINKYNDELESLKIRINNTTNYIDNILKEFDYKEELIDNYNDKISRR